MVNFARNIIMKPVHVTAAVIRKNRRILLCGRARKSVYADELEFPGGKQEPGETLPQCLQREIREELGADVLVLDQIGENIVQVGDKCYHLHFLRAMFRPDSPEPVPREGQKMFWGRTAELDSAPMLPGDAHLAALLAEAEKTENLSIRHNKTADPAFYAVKENN